MNPRTPLRILLIGCFALVPTSSLANQLARDAPIDLSLKDADLVNVLSVFATLQDLSLDIPSSVRGTVTVELNAVPWQQALDGICQVQDLQCRVEPPLLLVRPDRSEGDSDGAPITIDLLNADLHETLRVFGTITDTTVTIDPSLPKRAITVALEAVPWPLALEEVCRLGGCEVDASAGIISITALPAATVRARRIDLALDGTPLQDVLAHFSGLPMWGGTMQLEVEPALPARRVTIDVRDASWSDLLDALCDDAACSWKLIYAQNSVRTLRITALDSVLTQRHDMAAFDGPLGEATEHLREVLSTPLKRVGGLSDERPVSWSAGTHTGNSLLDQLCKQADCTWHLRGRGVVLAPRRAAFSQTPTKGTHGPTFLARTDTTGAPAQAMVRFSWAHPVARLGDDTTESVFVWLPFGEGRQMILPIAVRSHEIGHQAEMLEPILLPLDSPWTARAAGSKLSLTSASGDDLQDVPLVAPSQACFYCSPEAPVVSVRATDLPWQELHLATRPGNFLLLTPPNGSRPNAATPSSPTAAIVTLGLDADGTATVVLIEPRPDGSFAIDRVRVDRNGSHAQVGTTALTLQLTPAPGS